MSMETCAVHSDQFRFRLCRSAGCKGVSDAVGARSSTSTLWNTRKDNRSIRFGSTW
ncbi:hypothetical protein ACFYUJ_22280 [Streptomyces sp. NPDC004520]|uniref:hypothetical protein n=1 Tax=Streptomyces sp. NPDC004520 TaxID=3364702 RepID=UPI0036BFB5C7